MAFLELVRGQLPGTKYELDDSQAVIGRSSDCHVSLDIPAISRRHAAVVTDRGMFYVEDLGSRNGTFVNNRRVDGRVPLHEGDQILICDQTFEFHSGHRGARLGGSSVARRGSLTEQVDAGSQPPAAELIDDAEEENRASVMATLELSGGGSASWRISAQPEVKLRALLEISNNLRMTLSVDEILPKILDSLFTVFLQADRGFVVMRPGDDRPLIPVAFKGRRPTDEENMRISRTIVEEAMNGRKAILSADAASDDRFSMAQSIADFQIRSMICAPMLNNDGESIGVIQIDTLNQRSKFTEEDLEVLAGVASQAAVALDNAKMHEAIVQQRAVQRDLELANVMQRALLPSAPPDVTGYHFFDYYEPAREVGGDYYDYIKLRDGRIAVVVGDVAGKGVPAALLMARLSSDVRFSLATQPNTAQAVTEVNARFSDNDFHDRFVTMIFAVLHPDTHELTLVNAGHMPPLLRHADGGVEEIGDAEAGPPIGVVDRYEYESYTRTLKPGEFVTIFTDGFSEAMNQERELFGMERLTDLVGTGSVAVLELGEHVLNGVRDFVAGCAQSDDMCLACFWRHEDGA